MKTEKYMQDLIKEYWKGIQGYCDLEPSLDDDSIRYVVYYDQATDNLMVFDDGECDAIHVTMRKPDNWDELEPYEWEDENCPEFMEAVEKAAEDYLYENWELFHYYIPEIEANKRTDNWGTK